MELEWLVVLIKIVLDEYMYDFLVLWLSGYVTFVVNCIPIEYLCRFVLFLSSLYSQLFSLHTNLSEWQINGRWMNDDFKYVM